MWMASELRCAQDDWRLCQIWQELALEFVIAGFTAPAFPMKDGFLAIPKAGLWVFFGSHSHSTKLGPKPAFDWNRSVAGRTDLHKLRYQSKSKKTSQVAKHLAHCAAVPPVSWNVWCLEDLKRYKSVDLLAKVHIHVGWILPLGLLWIWPGRKEIRDLQDQWLQDCPETSWTVMNHEPSAFELFSPGIWFLFLSAHPAHPEPNFFTNSLPFP